VICSQWLIALFGTLPQIHLDCSWRISPANDTKAASLCPLSDAWLSISYLQQAPYDMDKQLFLPLKPDFYNFQDEGT
jgi:hypothetical protein